MRLTTTITTVALVALLACGGTNARTPSAASALVPAWHVENGAVTCDGADYSQDFQPPPDFFDATATLGHRCDWFCVTATSAPHPTPYRETLLFSLGAQGWQLQVDLVGAAICP